MLTSLLYVLVSTVRAASDSPKNKKRQKTKKKKKKYTCRTANIFLLQTWFCSRKAMGKPETVILFYKNVAFAVILSYKNVAFAVILFYKNVAFARFT